MGGTFNFITQYDGRLKCDMEMPENFAILQREKQNEIRNDG